MFNDSTSTKPNTQLTLQQQQTVLDNINLVPYVLGILKPDRNHWEDCKSVGTLALMNASQLYDPSVGTSFASYAIPAIRNKIIQYLGSIKSVTYVPRNLMLVVHKVHKVMSDNGCTMKEACNQLNVSYENVYKASCSLIYAGSTPVANEDSQNDYSLQLPSGSTEEIGYSIIEQRELFDKCYKLIDELDLRDTRKNICITFLNQLYNGTFKSYTALGKQCGVSRQRTTSILQEFFQVITTNIL